jgi:16S rRNA processing protein RimM
LIVGRIVRPHGVQGDLAMRVITDYPERLSEIETLYVGSDYQPYSVVLVRHHRKGIILRLDGVGDRNTAEFLRDQMVYVHISDAVPLEEGEYYLFQLEGIRVVTDEGQELGHLTGLIETGANDVYVITGADGREILIPAIPDVIKQVDVAGRVMTIHLLEGLL